MKELLFSVTSSDCDWEFTKGSGNGGQKRNKTATAVRVTHRASGAKGYAEDATGQLQNRRAAFKRMAETPQFKAWIKKTASQISLTKDQLRKREADIDRIVKSQMTDDKILVEYF